MANPIIAALLPVLGDLLSPLKTALENAEKNPQDVLAELQNLAIDSVEEIPELEDTAITGGASEALTLLNGLEAHFTGGSTSAAAPTPAPAPAAKS